ncbi:flagellar capping protein [gamma proteobacterium HIMB55]|nr:flagellar capping protein [gamma proteobacterium HIMB55]
MPTLGIYGSGLDTNAIVAALVNAEVAPLTARLDRQERERNAELSSLGGLKASLSSIESSLETLEDGTAFDALTISSPSEVSVTQSGTASAGRFEMSVTNLASAHSLYSASFAATTTEVGTGTLTIDIGTPTYVSGSAGAYSGFSSSTTTNITIDSTNNTVAGIRDAINDADAGVTAAILLDGSNVRLVVSSNDTGASNAVAISVSDGDGANTDASGLSQLAYHYDSTTAAHVGNLTESQAAEDASFSLNGIALTNASNSISGLIDGLDFTLNDVTTSAVNVVVEQDQAAIIDDIEAFVDAYNAYQSSLARSMSYDEVNGGGVFQGDSMARQLSAALRKSLTDEVTGLSGSTTLLSTIGITADRYGQLSIDSTELTSALSTNATAVREFFAGDGTNDGLSKRILDTADIYTNSSTGLIVSRETSIQSLLDKVDDDRLVIERRMASLETRYLRQFTAMDALVGQLQSTSDFLTNQLKNIPGQNSD